MKFSIICVYNNREILDNCLLASLKKQTIPYELILLDSTGHQFRSAAEALNHGASQATGEYLMFIHQDMDLASADFLEKCLTYLENLDNLGIAGVAGRVRSTSGIVTNIIHGVPPRTIPGERFDSPKKVQTLDECLLIIPKVRFRETPFDPVTCDNWHLYGVDYCLTMQSRGFKVVVLPQSAHHLSEGASMNATYFDSLGKVIKKHKPETDVIATTVHNWTTSQPIWYQKIMFSISSDLNLFYIWSTTHLNDITLKFYLQKYAESRSGIYLKLSITEKENNIVHIGRGTFTYSKNWERGNSSPLFPVTDHVSPDRLVQTWETIIGDHSRQGTGLEFIFAFHVIESQKDVINFLDDCKRSLDEKGILVLTCIHKESTLVCKDRTSGKLLDFSGHTTDELIRLIDNRRMRILAVTTRSCRDISIICRKESHHAVDNSKYFYKHAFWRFISTFRADKTWKNAK